MCYTPKTMNYNQQLTIVKTLIPQGDLDMRCDCPFCHHSNTFVVKREQSELKWYCFSASCSARGKHEVEMSMQQVIETVVTENKAKQEKEKPFVLPTSFISILSEQKCYDYLINNNCIQAKQKAKASFMYDVKQHRIVFLIKNKEKILGAIGRALNSKVYPKWYVYGSKSYPFICGDSDIGVLVEDCASACAVSSVYSGIALMGTSLPESYIPVLKKKYKKIIVALDRDATTKSFDISGKLNYYVNTEVKILQDDLKYYNEKQIKEILNA
tara:strand:+ start:4001 stop:4810 length:810 start_codon:yes stop_codon:yes gene_type:complete